MSGPATLPALPDPAELRARFGDDLLIGHASGTELVAAPRTAAEVAELLTLASERRWRVTAVGAGTWRSGPQPAGLVVSTSRLTGVFEHEPEDLVVGVRAGTTHEEVQEAVRQARQFLPLDPPAAPGATIGATVALRSAGPLRAGYGTPRDLVLGLEMVTGDGRLLRFGGRVVKNVAGYDGVRLVTGSRGRLGIITAAFIRLRSLPRMDRTLAVRADSASGAAALALAMRDAATCEALEVLSPTTSGLIGLSAEWHVLARLHGSREGVEERLGRLRRAAAAPASQEGQPLTPLWQRLCSVEAAARPALELTCPPAGVAAALAALDRRLGGAWALAAHATDGVIRAWGADAAAPVPALEDVRQIAASCGGTARWLIPPEGVTASAPAGLSTSATAEAVQGAPAEAGSEPDDPVRQLSRRIAAAFDPAGIFAHAEVW